MVAPPSLAQAPAWSRGQQLLSITYEDCVRRATSALQAEGYRIDHAAGNFAVGMKEVHTAVIMCNPLPEAKEVVNIVVGSNGDAGGCHREKLQAQMERTSPTTPIAPPCQASQPRAQPPPQPPPQPQPPQPQPPQPQPPPQPPARSRYLTVRLSGRHAVVEWSNAPTSTGSWVSIVLAGTPDGAHSGMYQHTAEKASGRYEKGPLDPGAYEARFYADHYYGQLVDRVRFEVGAETTGVFQRAVPQATPTGPETLLSTLCREGLPRLPTYIHQSGNSLIFTNESGSRSRGYAENNNTVIASDWEGGLRGTISSDRSRIDWANGTSWQRCPQ